MASGTFFVKSCVTCGRLLEIRVELLGKKVECVHCGAGFIAREANDDPDAERVEQALALAQAYIDSVASVARNNTAASRGC